MVPQPSTEHLRLGRLLLSALTPVAERLGMEPFYEVALYRRAGADQDYRVPDLSFALPAQISKRGLEGACEFLIEILSPNDETYEKLPFYAELGIKELLVASPETRQVELYALRGPKHVLVSADEKGAVRSQVLGVAFATVAGPKLRLSFGGGQVEVEPRLECAGENPASLARFTWSRGQGRSAKIDFCPVTAQPRDGTKATPSRTS